MTCDFWPLKTYSVVRLRRDSNAGPLTHKASPNQPTEGFGVLCHVKRECKPCVYCNTETNHTLEILLNVQKGKSNVPVDPSLHCFAHERTSLFTPRHIYTHTSFEGRPKQVCTIETLKQH